MAGRAELDAMRRAVELAADVRGRTNPNPPVGCVLLDPAGRTLAEGRHERAGGPHAEVAALQAAGPAARGGTAVVTLEPCRHSGRTGPCTRALIDAGIRRVVYAVADPSPWGAGGGAELAAAGVEVQAGVLAAEAERPAAEWLAAVRAGRPHLTWKFAATLDGRTAAADGSSRWLTGPAARRDAHLLRAVSDAVLVGAATVRADDPRLSVRDLDWPRQPVRVVVDGRASVPPTSHVCDGSQPTVLLVGATADPERVKGLRSTPVEVVEVADLRGVLSADDILGALWERELRVLLVEGGARLAATFVAADRVDRVVAYQAPALLGSGVAVLDDVGASSVQQLRRLRLVDVRVLGDDVRMEAGR